MSEEISDSSHTRVRVFALLMLIIISVVVARLWMIQGVLGTEYKRQSEQNRIRRISLDAPRGLIFDRNNQPLVKNRLAVAVTIEPEMVSDKKLLKKLSPVLNMSVAEIMERAEDPKNNLLEPRPVKRDIGPETVAYIKERSHDFIGVDLRVEAIREYPQGRLAAHIIGYLGELSEEEQKMDDFANSSLGDLVGKSGVERWNEGLLSGSKGTEFVEVNASGQSVRVMKRKEAVPGNNLVLTIDKNIQASAESALEETIAEVRRQKFPKASAGALVVMTPQSKILAMASYPSYDPAIFIGGINNEDWAVLTDKNNDFPLNNRAIMSGYAPASTFKVVTAVSGFETSRLGLGTTVYCRGRWLGLGRRWGKWCWDRSGHGVNNVVGALSVSCDSFFYDIGHRLHKLGQEDLQDSARRLGFGAKTGIDLPSEIEGRIPTAEWKKKWNKDWPENQAWFPGDTVNMAIGQGDVLATPLQIGNVYAALANGGTLYKPRVVDKVIGLDGRPVYSSKDEKMGAINIQEAQLEAIKRGLRLVVSARDGTARAAFSGFPVSVSGKTGTAEVFGKDDFALFVAYAPTDDPKYIVSVVIEQGGHGGSGAAPAARRVLEDIFQISEEPDRGGAGEGLR